MVIVVVVMNTIDILKEAYREIVNTKKNRSYYGIPKKFPYVVKVDSTTSIHFRDEFSLDIIYDPENTNAISKVADVLYRYKINPLAYYVNIEESNKGSLKVMSLQAKYPKDAYQKEPKIYGKFRQIQEIWLLDKEGRRIKHYKEGSFRNIKYNEKILDEYDALPGEEGINLWGKKIEPRKCEPWKINKGMNVVVEQAEDKRTYIAKKEGVLLYKRDMKSKTIEISVVEGIEIPKLSSLATNGDSNLEFPYLKYLKIHTTDKMISLSAPQASIYVDNLESIQKLEGKTITVNYANRYSHSEKGRSKVPIYGEKIVITGEMHYCDVKSKEIMFRKDVYVSNSLVRASRVFLNGTTLGNVIITPINRDEPVRIKAEYFDVRSAGAKFVNPIMENIRSINGKENIEVILLHPHFFKMYEENEMKTLCSIFPYIHVFDTKNNTKIKMRSEDLIRTYTKIISSASSSS